MLSHYQLHFWPKFGQKCQSGQFLAKSTSISGNTALTISHFRFLYQMLPEYTFGAKFLGILAFSENIWLKSHINIWPAHYFTTSVSCWYLSQPKFGFELSHSPSTEENTSPRSSSLDLSSPLPFPAGPPARIRYLSQPKLNLSSVTHRPPK